MPVVHQKDIAERAGVSYATVSRVLRSPEKVRPQLTELVHQAMRELGLEVEGGELREARRAYNVLVIVNDLAYSLYSSFLTGIAQNCNERGLSMVICNSGGDIAVEKKAIDTAVRGSYVGVIFMTAEDTQPYRDMIREITIPVVFLNRKIDGMDYDSVLLAHFETAQQAIRSLLKAGHRRIAMLSPDKDTTNVRAERAGYIDALLQSGTVTYPQAEQRIFYLPNSYEGGRQFAKRYTMERMKLDALYVISSEQSIGLINGFLEFMGRMPHELYLLILNRSPVLPGYLPKLAVMEQPVTEMGRRAVDVLMERAAHPDREPMNILFNAIIPEKTRPDQGSSRAAKPGVF